MPEPISSSAATSTLTGLALLFTLPGVDPSVVLGALTGAVCAAMAVGVAKSAGRPPPNSHRLLTGASPACMRAWLMGLSCQAICTRLSTRRHGREAGSVDHHVWISRPAAACGVGA